MNMDAEASVNVASPEDLGRCIRSRKKTLSQIVCPVCGVTVRQSDLNAHFAVELQNLENTSTAKKLRKDRPNARVDSPEAASSSSAIIADSGDRPASWGTYQSIKRNRQTRLKTKARKRKPMENVICPVCNRITKEDIHEHVEKCLNLSAKRQKTTCHDEDDDDLLSSGDSIDVGGEGPWEPHEVYEWAGQTRIRASSLLPGGSYSRTGIGSNSLTNTALTSAENDEDLNVMDGDDVIYGPPQYHEKDVIPPPQSQEGEKYLRSLIAGVSPACSANKSGNGTEALQDTENGNASDHSTADSNEIPSSPLSMQGQILESLKARLKDYEQSSSREKIKCQICMDEYKNPCVSVCCWHVHCEDCWLRTLGSRKLCPKCNMITSATDLRRIYL